MSQPILKTTKFDTKVNIKLEDLADDRPWPPADSSAVRQWVETMSAHSDRLQGRLGFYDWARDRTIKPLSNGRYGSTTLRGNGY